MKMVSSTAATSPLKCMMYAYQLLGAYAGDDPETYRKLIHITSHMAHLELHMHNDPDEDGEVPKLSVVLDTKDPDEAERRLQKHLADTADRTRNLISMAEGRGA
jgi:hypothetical protein